MSGMTEVLLDSDALIDHLRGYRYLKIEETMSVSVVTRVELYAGHEREESAVAGLLERLAQYDVDPAIARRAGRIKRGTGLKMADALIAATALEHGLPLMTRNRRHFERVPGLVLRDPPADSPSSRAASQSGTTE